MQDLLGRHGERGAHCIVQHALDVDLAAAAFGGNAALGIDRIDRRRAARGDMIDGGAHVSLTDTVAVADEHLNPKDARSTCERIAVSLPEAEPASQSHPQTSHGRDSVPPLQGAGNQPYSGSDGDYA